MQPWLIGLATVATLARIWVLIGVSIVSGWGLAWLATRSRAFENVYVPLVNVLESIPVLAFLPIVLVIFVSGVGGRWGVEAAVDFLVFDAVTWNIWIGAYQSFKTVPENLYEVGENYGLGTGRLLWHLFIPHSVPRISSNLFSSFADAFFYISVSEVFAIGIHSYAVFGIGTYIAQFTAANDYLDLSWALAFVAVAVVVFTLLIGEFSQRAVAKYGVDTSGEIVRRAGPGGVAGGWKRFIRGPMRRVSSYETRRSVEQLARAEAGVPPRTRGTGWWVGMTIVVGFVGLILYGSARVVLSVPGGEWGALFAQTPFLLYAMGVDYLRVALVTVAALGLSVTLGYYLATHGRASRLVAPAIQTIAAYPVPTYFPLVFGATFGFLSAALPWGYAEVYIFVLAFLSCFYYVFFDFWVGVRAIPTEFWEVMQNHELGYWTRMRRVVLPATFPYIVTGVSSTVNSAWAGLAIGEFWPLIYGNHNLVASVGMMKYIYQNLAVGNVADAAWVSLLFGAVVMVYGFVFTRGLMDVARKRYVIEEGVYAA